MVSGVALLNWNRVKRRQPGGKLSGEIVGIAAVSTRIIVAMSCAGLTPG